MRIASVVQDSIVDGYGLRAAVFVQGCSHGCPGCHNPQTHDPGGGRTQSPEALAALLAQNPLLDGLTLTGGEPMEQARACAALARLARAQGLNVWVYTGYVYEQLLQEADPDRLALLAQTDVLVDGPFILAQRSLELRWRGSANQRVIDLNETRRSGRVTLWQEPEFYKGAL